VSSVVGKASAVQIGKFFKESSSWYRMTGQVILQSEIHLWNSYATLRVKRQL